MKTKIRIGTRSSLLAIQQAKQVEKKLIEQGWKTEIITIESSGDINLIQPIYEMNLRGVFTKELDTALVNDYIDVAVHSLKDVPTKLPLQLQLSSVLERDFPQDVLIRNYNCNNKKNGFENLFLLTGSPRRKAFWKNHCKNGEFDSIRGSVQTRLKKLQQSNADGTFLSLAGIKRLNLDVPYEILDFMISAPAQGVIGMVSHIKNQEINQVLYSINHQPTMQCVQLEREFLRLLEGGAGCSTPIGAFAEKKQNFIQFSGQLSSFNGARFIKIEASIKNKNDMVNLVKKLLIQGGKSILEEIKSLNNYSFLI